MLDEGGKQMEFGCTQREGDTVFADDLALCGVELPTAERVAVRRTAAPGDEVPAPAPDHPVPANFPEGHYLTSVLAAIG